MTRYSVQPRDRIFVKRYGFLCLARNVGRSMSKTLSSIYSEKLLDHAKFLIIQSAKDALGNSLKKAIQKTAVIQLGVKLLIKLPDSQKLHHRKIQKQLKKKYLEKDIYLQKKDWKLLMI